MAKIYKKTATTTADILEYALTKLWGKDGRRWIKYSYHLQKRVGGKEVDTYCLMGGIAAASRQLNASGTERLKARNTVLHNIRKVYKGHNYHSIPQFNDQTTTKFSHIKGVVCESLKQLVKE